MIVLVIKQNIITKLTKKKYEKDFKSIIRMRVSQKYQKMKKFFKKKLC